MNLYITTRWGNPYEEDGPDGKDTNFLVKAETHKQASEVTDFYLLGKKTQIGTNRPVQNFCHRIILISESVLGKEEPQIIHGPWIESAIFFGIEQSSGWTRDEQNENWEKDEPNN